MKMYLLLLKLQCNNLRMYLVVLLSLTQTHPHHTSYISVIAKTIKGISEIHLIRFRKNCTL